MSPFGQYGMVAFSEDAARNVAGIRDDYGQRGRIDPGRSRRRGRGHQPTASAGSNAACAYSILGQPTQPDDGYMQRNGRI